MKKTNGHIVALPEWLGWLGFIAITIGVYAVVVSMAGPFGYAVVPSSVPGAGSTQPTAFTPLDRYIESLALAPEKQAPARQVKRKIRAGAKKIGRYNAIITAAAHRYDVDADLVKAIIMAESSFNPRAVSRDGAKGLMQLMPATARELGVEDCFNPHHNINGGVRYLKWLLSRYDNDIALSLAAYNAGIGNVREYGGIPPFSETRYYVQKVWNYYRYYKTRSATSPPAPISNV